MLISFARRVLQTPSSDTLTLSATANQLKAQGKPIINLTVGEPHFLTPEPIRQAVIGTLKQGLYAKYTAVEGMLSLKTAIIKKFLRDNQLQYSPEQIIVTTGAKQAIYNLMQTLLEEGDEVIIPAPYWGSYPAMVALTSASTVVISSSIEQHFKITPEQLEQAITPKTKLLILNNPNNPTGVVYRHEELQALSEVLLKHPNIIILSDDIYESIYWAPVPFKNIVQICPALYDRTVVVNGVSKAYAMTGWRIGYAAGAKELIKYMTLVQSQSTSCPNAIAQFAAQVALEIDPQYVCAMNQTYQENHMQMQQALNQIPNIHCLAAKGAFYSFPAVHTLLKNTKLKTDIELAEYLLHEAHLATVPGTGFGAPGHLRFSFALESDLLKEALARFDRAIRRLCD
jgi:aspartate aminotransferase